MLEKEKFCRFFLIKKFKIIFFTFFLFLIFINASQANLREKIIKKLEETNTLSFNFIQKIAENEEVGKCFIKYPLLMKCDYQNEKKKTLISNGKTVAIIKKKYKKIYYYPIKRTPLFIILNKKNLLNFVKNNAPSKITFDTVEFELVNKDSNALKIIFDKKTLELKGWETKDLYSNKVSFLITNIEKNIQINSNFFKIPKEENL